MSIIENVNRIGNFTSSNAWKLMTKAKDGKSFGKPALAYISQCNLERKLGRSVKTESYSRDMAWGTFCEIKVESMVEFGYELVSNTTLLHPIHKFWAGSTDMLKASEKIGEIKAYQPQNFAEYADCLAKQSTDNLRDNFPEEYWQLVSNSIINQVPKAEAILYMPYESELIELAEMAENYDQPDQWKYRFIAESPKSELAYLPNDCKHYTNLIRFEFIVPENDKIALGKTMIEASKLLIER